MYDVTIIGGGPAANSCYDVLTRAGLSVTRSFELEPGDRSPLILGEAHGAYLIARQAAEVGRHLLVATPQVLTPERLSLLLENRGRAQALFVWSERRYHPGYRLLAGLTEADATWRPRFLRGETLSLEPSSTGLFRLRALEAVGLAVSIAAAEPVEVAARASASMQRNSFDLLNLEVTFPELRAFLQIGLGEAVERRETLLAATSRKAYVDELNESMPLRLVEDDARPGSNQARWLSCPSPSAEELARQQCLAFLDATLNATLAQKEATLWQRCLAVLQSMDRSLQTDATEIPVEMQEEQPRFRLILGRAMGATPPSVA
ncbi:MAG TPA: hypothetical protein VIB47_07430 [Dehalococcoidia bacterium]